MTFRSEPDTITAKNADDAVRRELESRAGIGSLDDLLAERRTLVIQVAPLRAKYGSFGTADNLRKIELSKIAAIIRAEKALIPEKVTEAAIDQLAHADDRYIAFVTQLTDERRDWIILEDAISAIEDRIRADRALVQFAAAEARL